MASYPVEEADMMVQEHLTPAERAEGMSKSMHNGVAISCDCCSCEAEPYWAALADENEADTGSGTSESSGMNNKEIAR
ncbi:MAG: hypothetical protein MI754_09525 [Chromatiales bacterium]|nr:hypothetical protein [Chromatiales bacterium]